MPTFIFTNVAARPAMTVTPTILAVSEMSAMDLLSRSMTAVPSLWPRLHMTVFMASNVALMASQKPTGANAMPAVASDENTVE